jgi:hypothetical protein
LYFGLEKNSDELAARRKVPRTNQINVDKGRVYTLGWCFLEQLLQVFLWYLGLFLNLSPILQRGGGEKVSTLYIELLTIDLFILYLGYVLLSRLSQDAEDALQLFFIFLLWGIKIS